MLTPSQISELMSNGYSVEDMGVEHGEEFNGQYRWMNTNGDFQDYEVSFSPEDAWACAWAHYDKDD